MNNDIVKLIPFLSKEDLAKIANDVLEGKISNVDLVVVYPFLQHQDLENLVEKLIERNETRLITKSIPFISKEKVLDIYNAANSGKLPDFDVAVCIPFLDKDEVMRLFMELTKSKEQTE